MIYVAHPFEGKKENKEIIERLLAKIVEVDSANTYNSPVMSYGFLYDKIEHDLWTDFSIDLLMMCDKVYFFGDIESSVDCRIDLKMCKLLKKPYRIFKGKLKV